MLRCLLCGVGRGRLGQLAAGAPQLLRCEIVHGEQAEYLVVVVLQLCSLFLVDDLRVCPLLDLLAEVLGADEPFLSACRSRRSSGASSMPSCRASSSKPTGLPGSIVVYACSLSRSRASPGVVTSSTTLWTSSSDGAE